MFLGILIIYHAAQVCLLLLHVMNQRHLVVIHFRAQRLINRPFKLFIRCFQLVDCFLVAFDGFFRLSVTAVEKVESG